MTKREAIYQLKRLFREVNADSRLTNRLAYSVLQKHSRWLIKRDSERLSLLKKSNLFKTLKCVKVIEAPAVDPCCGIKSHCKVWRTETPLPDIFEDNNGPIIRNITTIDSSKEIRIISPTAWLRKSKNPWRKNNSDKYAFYSDNHLYFPNGGYKMIQVEAYFEESISDYNDCNSDDSDDSTSSGNCGRFLDEDFNIPDYLEGQLFDYAIKDIGGTYARIPEASTQIDKKPKPDTSKS